MGTLWIPGAENLPVSVPGGTITSTAPPRAVWHATEADPGTSSVWQSMIHVLNDRSAEPHILYDPLTDRLGQFFPLNLSGRALRNDGTTRTNRVGKVCIQIEVIARSAEPFTLYWKPGPNWRALIAAIRSWGIPDVQPAGPFPRFITSPPHNVPEDDRDRATWLSKGGHYSHSQIPGNDHGDPGGVSFPAMLAAGKPIAPEPPKEDNDMSQSQYDALMQAIGDVKDDIRAYALWQALYGLETEDERAQAQAAFDDARAAGKSIAEAKAAAIQVLQSLVDDVKQSQAKT